MISATLSSADVIHLPSADYYEGTTTTTPPPPPHPYAFSYTAGRFSGHIDRTHSEVSDGSGVVRGAFSYIDPRQEIRTVEYTADKQGFHPVLSHAIDEPRQTEAVKQATIRHIEQYNRIAEQNANVSNQIMMKMNRNLITMNRILLNLFQSNLQGNIVVPSDSYAVAKAKERHQTLYEQIAEEHQRLGAELEAKRLLFESTSEKEFDAYGSEQ